MALPTPVLVRLLLDLDTYGGVYSLCVFTLFVKRVRNIIAAKLGVIVRRLIRQWFVPECWRSSIVTALSSGASHDKENY